METGKLRVVVVGGKFKPPSKENIAIQLTVGAHNVETATQTGTSPCWNQTLYISVPLERDGTSGSFICDTELTITKLVDGDATWQTPISLDSVTKGKVWEKTLTVDDEQLSLWLQPIDFGALSSDTVIHGSSGGASVTGTGRLRVLVEKAVNLPSPKPPNAFVQVTIEQQSRTTNYEKDTHNPIWNETFWFRVPLNEIDGYKLCDSTVKVIVWNLAEENLKAQKSKIGEAQLFLKPLNFGQATPHQINLGPAALILHLTAMDFGHYSRHSVTRSAASSPASVTRSYLPSPTIGLGGRDDDNKSPITGGTVPQHVTLPPKLSAASSANSGWSSGWSTSISSQLSSPLTGTGSSTPPNLTPMARTPSPASGLTPSTAQPREDDKGPIPGPRAITPPVAVVGRPTGTPPRPPSALQHRSSKDRESPLIRNRIVDSPEVDLSDATVAPPSSGRKTVSAEQRLALQVEDLKKEVEEHQLTVRQLERKLMDKDTHLQTLEHHFAQKNGVAEQEIAKLEHELRTVNARASPQKRSRERDPNDTLDNLNVSSSTLSEYSGLEQGRSEQLLMEKDMQITELSDKLEMAERRIKDKDKEINQLREELDRTADRSARMHHELQQVRDEYEGKLQGMDETVQDLAAQLKLMEHTKSQFQQSAGQTQELVSDIRTKLVEEEDNNYQLQVQLESTKITLAKAVKQVADSQLQLSGFREQLQGTKAQLNDAHMECERLRIRQGIEEPPRKSRGEEHSSSNVSMRESYLQKRIREYEIQMKLCSEQIENLNFDLRHEKDTNKTLTKALADCNPALAQQIQILVAPQKTPSERSSGDAAAILPRIASLDNDPLTTDDIRLKRRSGSPLLGATGRSKSLSSSNATSSTTSPVLHPLNLRLPTSSSSHPGHHHIATSLSTLTDIAVDYSYSAPSSQAQSVTIEEASDTSSALNILSHPSSSKHERDGYGSSSGMFNDTSLFTEFITGIGRDSYDSKSSGSPGPRAAVSTIPAAASVTIPSPSPHPSPPRIPLDKAVRLTNQEDKLRREMELEHWEELKAFVSMESRERYDISQCILKRGLGAGGDTITSDQSLPTPSSASFSVPTTSPHRRHTPSPTSSMEELDIVQNSNERDTQESGHTVTPPRQPVDDYAYFYTGLPSPPAPKTVPLGPYSPSPPPEVKFPDDKKGKSKGPVIAVPGLNKQILQQVTQQNRTENSPYTMAFSNQDISSNVPIYNSANIYTGSNEQSEGYEYEDDTTQEDTFETIPAEMGTLKVKILQADGIDFCYPPPTARGWFVRVCIDGQSQQSTSLCFQSAQAQQPLWSEDMLITTVPLQLAAVSTVSKQGDIESFSVASSPLRLELWCSDTHGDNRMMMALGTQDLTELVQGLSRQLCIPVFPINNNSNGKYTTTESPTIEVRLAAFDFGVPPSHAAAMNKSPPRHSPQHMQPFTQTGSGPALLPPHSAPGRSASSSSLGATPTTLSGFLDSDRTGYATDETHDSLYGLGNAANRSPLVAQQASSPHERPMAVHPHYPVQTQGGRSPVTGNRPSNLGATGGGSNQRIGVHNHISVGIGGADKNRRSETPSSPLLTTDNYFTTTGNIPITQSNTSTPVGSPQRRREQPYQVGGGPKSAFTAKSDHVMDITQHQQYQQPSHSPVRTTTTSTPTLSPITVNVPHHAGVRAARPTGTPDFSQNLSNTPTSTPPQHRPTYGNQQVPFHLHSVSSNPVYNRNIEYPVYPVTHGSMYGSPNRSNSFPVSQSGGALYNTGANPPTRQQRYDSYPVTSGGVNNSLMFTNNLNTNTPYYSNTYTTPSLGGHSTAGPAASWGTGTNTYTTLGSYRR